ncbi:hypothetical protein DM01DRAFT_1384645 [Hesseltinella vesiculosa]|uniref:STAS domain-containing protein n=1 Tax=Hesseltinella vesiculosa TaxID=101127 RepID=A0A1X2GD00_9FUNG|nr:hypothetical protein DM01DRAFT_1384645 [Hesseltinella vesiculosa]
MPPITVDYTPNTLKSKWRHSRQHFPWLMRTYVASFFPVRKWIHHYNLSWFLQDLIAGVTVGIVLVPQGMAYAKLANLDPQFGLYSSFAGVILYCLFGTSKDISIGLICPAIAGYMTGSAITISLGQLPKLFGLSHVDSHQSPYRIVIEFFSNLSQTKLDAAFGLTALLLLYVIKYGCQYLGKRVDGRKERALFYIEIMRNGFIVILGTLVSFGINYGQETSLISIIRDVPAGFVAMGVPQVDTRILSASSNITPSIIIIMILEHVSVAKSFGRIYDYAIEPNQEIFAIGVSNVVGSFFGGAPATGAFSRTAIMARSGVATPAAGIFSGAVVVLALYALTPAFYYIPDAVLAAVVIHAVVDLVSKPKYLKRLLNTSMLEFLVWLAGVVVTICVDVPTGIYVAVGTSMLIMLGRLARPPVKLLARVPMEDAMTSAQKKIKTQHTDETTVLLPDRFLYVDERDANFQTQCKPLPSGLLVFRLDEPLIYPNGEYVAETILANIKTRTNDGSSIVAPIADDLSLKKKKETMPWNKACQKDLHHHHQRLHLPILKALVLDFASVNRLDSTALQCLENLKNNVEAYAGQSVEWHFTGLQHHPQVRRDLVNFGFGGTTMHSVTHESLSSPSCSRTSQSEVQEDQLSIEKTDFPATSLDQSSIESVVISGMPQDAYQFFHWDVDTAVSFITSRWHQEA